MTNSPENKKPLSKGLIALIVIVAIVVISGFSSMLNKPTSNKNDTIAESTKNENLSKTSTTISNSTTIESGIIFNLSIANGGGVSGLGKKVAELFKKLKYSDGEDKYNISHITNADKYNYENTQIICKSEDSLILKAAEDIKTILKVGVITTSNEISKDTDIAIIIGKDYSLDTEMATESTTGTSATTTTTAASTTTVILKEIGDEVMAFGYARDAVYQMLAAPSTARFASIIADGVTINKVGTNQYLVSSYVDSENGFGAMIRMRYKILVTFKAEGSDGSYRYTCKFLSFG